MSDDIVKKDVFASNAKQSIQLNKGKLRSTSTPFQERVNQARSAQVDVAMLPNRLGLMLDRSSSMSQRDGGSTMGPNFGESKIILLKQAVSHFIDRCNLSDTAIAIETFPKSESLGLTNVPFALQGSVQGISAGGDTPMRGCVELMLERVPMTRGIIVSDGEATDWNRYGSGDIEDSSNDSVLNKYREASIPIDCVHIGSSTSGEQLLRKIAQLTGGIYMKFTDVNAFAQAFAYLTPGYRAMLTNGSVDAAKLGAKEIQR